MPKPKGRATVIYSAHADTPAPPAHAPPSSLRTDALQSHPPSPQKTNNPSARAQAPPSATAHRDSQSARAEGRRDDKCYTDWYCQDRNDGSRRDNVLQAMLRKSWWDRTRASCPAAVGLDKRTRPQAGPPAPRFPFQSTTPAQQSQAALRPARDSPVPASVNETI